MIQSIVKIFDSKTKQMKETLRELIDKYGSDKNRNEYTPIYSSLFEPRRNQSINLLEIGIGTMIEGVPSSMVGYSGEGYKPGGSLRAFRDYFQNGWIYGGDIQTDCMFEEERIITFLFDSTKRDKCDEALKDMNLDIIIDDGLHTYEAQIATFQNLWDRLKPNGLYFIEDIAPHNPLSQQWKHVFEDIDAEKWTNEYKNIIVFQKK